MQRLAMRAALRLFGGQQQQQQQHGTTSTGTTLLGEAKAAEEIADNRPIEITLGGVKMVYSAAEKRWVSDTSEMFQAAEELHRLCDENEFMRGRLEESNALLKTERDAKDASLVELLSEKQKNQRLSSENSNLKGELDAAYETIAKLKTHLLDPTIPLRAGGSA